jgi:hypothetical protein
MKHRIKVVMLPTEDTTLFVAKNNNKQTLLVIPRDNVHKNRLLMGGNYVYKHTYATISQDVEPIKEDDWCINPKGFPEMFGYDFGAVYTKEEILKCRKIIATTDPKLTLKSIPSKEYKNVRDIVNGVPQLQQSSIKEFVNNPDGEFEVEYETMWKNKGKNGLQPFPDATTTDRRITLKLNQDNTVNITCLKEKMYTIKEVTHLMKISITRGSHSEAGIETENPFPCLCDNKWINKKLNLK